MRSAFLPLVIAPLALAASACEQAQPPRTETSAQPAPSSPNRRSSADTGVAPPAIATAKQIYMAIAMLGETRADVRRRLGNPDSSIVGTSKNLHVDAIDSTFAYIYGSRRFVFVWAAPVNREFLTEATVDVADPVVRPSRSRSIALASTQSSEGPGGRTRWETR